MIHKETARNLAILGEDPSQAWDPPRKRSRQLIVDRLLSAGRSFWRSDKDSDPGLRIIRDEVVRVRREVPCCGEPINSASAHNCPAGQMAYKETAIFDGRWVSAYVCSNCLLTEKK